MPWHEPGGPEVQSGVRSPEAGPEKGAASSLWGLRDSKTQPILCSECLGVVSGGMGGKQAWAPSASSSSSEKRPV